REHRKELRVAEIEVRRICLRRPNGPRGKSATVDPGGVATAGTFEPYVNGSEAASAATATATLAGFGFVHLEGTAPKVLAIERLHGARSIRIGHFDESEPTRAAGITIGDERQRLDRPVLRKQGANSVFGRGEGQIADK